LLDVEAVIEALLVAGFVLVDDEAGLVGLAELVDDVFAVTLVVILELDDKDAGVDDVLVVALVVSLELDDEDTGVVLLELLLDEDDLRQISARCWIAVEQPADLLYGYGGSGGAFVTH